MSTSFRIIPLLDLPADVEDLRAEAAQEGFRFIDKLVAEWRSGTNRFDQPGEVLLGAIRANDLIAVGGLNRDPYADQPGIGRLRHLYVRQTMRRCGVGSALVQELIGSATSTFHLVRLRTDTPLAADFYVGLGFRPAPSAAATHIWPLR
jgi:GNAT superfamily N-acetyltransferase